uniref:Uncharacterized protein n=1 Tax=Rhizophora mucronata TaxID=61149 RepID=A0A2P2QV37_RHIMU
MKVTYLMCCTSNANENYSSSVT